MELAWCFLGHTCFHFWFINTVQTGLSEHLVPTQKSDSYFFLEIECRCFSFVKIATLSRRLLIAETTGRAELPRVVLQGHGSHSSRSRNRASCFSNRCVPVLSSYPFWNFAVQLWRAIHVQLGQYKDTHVVLGSMTLQITRVYIRWDRQKARYPQLHRNKSQHESKAIMHVKGRRKQKTYYKLVRTSWKGWIAQAHVLFILIGFLREKRRHIPQQNSLAQNGRQINGHVCDWPWKNLRRQMELQRILTGLLQASRHGPVKAASQSQSF